MTRVSASARTAGLIVAASFALGALGAVPVARDREAARPADAAAQPARPNILWITSEDNGPQLGAYGDTYATTPNLDALAAKGYRYRVAWSNGPVCGASRTALITGVHPEATGGEHMRSLVRLPETIRLYPALLREAGYYVTNNSKTDYNYAEVEPTWHESSPNAHWKNRPDGAPFFAVFNFTDTHESQVRTRPHTWVHDVDQAPVPPYMPNVRETREDWAQYYDQIAVMDAKAGEKLREIEAAGLADDTIVMYFGDHGAGLPRSKRYPYNSGLRVPLIVYVPEKFRSLGPAEASKPGSESRRLVSFVDLPPTLLSLAGVEPPASMQGRAFMGRYTTPDPDYVYGFRGRMDERYDLTRSLRDQRYVYLRNYMPHRPYGQYVEYLFQTPTTAVWRRMYDEGRLQPPQTAFWEPKPSEELYDLDDDPHETRNLAASPAHVDVLQRMRRALDAHAREIRDVGFLPEYELYRDEAAMTAYERGHDAQWYDFDRIYAAATRASDRRVAFADFRADLSDRDPIVRYWAATGALIRGHDAVSSATADLERLLDDPHPGPRIVAAEALGRFGPPTFRDRAIASLLRDADPATWAGLSSERAAVLAAQFALYALNQFTDLPESVKREVAKLAPIGGRGAETPAQGLGMRALSRGDYRAQLKAAIAADVR